MKWYSGENLPRTHARPTFSEAWFHQRYAMTFGARYCQDPIFRTEQDREARRLLFERFGHLGVGERDPQPRPHLEVAGHRFIPALLGCEIYFQDDQPPACRHLPVESAAELPALPRPDLATNPWAVEFRRQAQVLVERYGQVDATINMGGPLNAAVNALGTQAFVFLRESPDDMAMFLSEITGLCLMTYDQLTVPYTPGAGKPADKPGSSEKPGLSAPGRELFVGNCPVAMISPATYHEHILRHDGWLRHNAARLGLHHCGVMDRYLEEYRCLAPLMQIEVGWGSDLAAVRRAFPDTLLDLMINIPDVSGMTAAELRRTIARMVEQAAPRELIRDVWLADIGPDVPDEVVANFVQAVDGALPA